MSGTIEGAGRAVSTNKKRDPEHYQKIGQRGGHAKVPKGFAAMDRAKVSEISRKGGTTKRKPKKSE